jgi:hypothetical protein
MSISCRPGTPRISLKRRQQPDVRPRAATCLTAPDPASLLRWAPALSCVPQLRTPPLCRGELWRWHMPLSSGPASPQERAPTVPHASWLRTLPPRGERSDVATCPMTLSGPWTMRIKKVLAILGTQLGSCVLKPRSRVTKPSARRANRRRHHSSQDVRAGHYSAAQQCSAVRLTTHRHGYRRCDPTRRYSTAEHFATWQSYVMGCTMRRPSHYLPITSYRDLATVIGH